MSQIAITGRLPEISIAELESLYGASAIRRIGDHALIDATVDPTRLGGTVKLADHIMTVPTSNPQKVFEHLRQALPVYLENFPEGKIKLGVSLYGMPMPLARHNANVLTLKKIIRQLGRSVRAIPNTDHALSSAQTFHNALTSPVGLELVLVAHEGKTFIGRVIYVQDIDSYTIRDRQRPKRDTFVGMLPPKLAQTMINLSTNDANASATVLDPFCGTGVVLIEAMIMGYDIYGSDIAQKMIDFSTINLDWLTKHPKIKVKSVDSFLEVADATTHQWNTARLNNSDSPIQIASEAYLGQPIGGQNPTPEKMQSIVHECNVIVRDFLKNIVKQVPKNTRLCLAVPSWRVMKRTYDLPVLDELGKLGYSAVSFEHTTTDQLIYRRDDQPTGRRLLVLLKQ